MNSGPPKRRRSNQAAGGVSSGLVALAAVVFDGLPPAQIVAAAAGAAAGVAPACRVEGSYRSVNGEMVPDPPGQPERPDIDRQIQESRDGGPVHLADRRWGWAFALRHQGVVLGCLVVSAPIEPEADALLLLTILARQAGDALGFAEHQERDALQAEQLTNTINRLRHAAIAEEVLGSALSAEGGEQGIADTLFRLTALAVVVEDRFGNLRGWAGPGRPLDYPKPTPGHRAEFLHRLAAHGGPMRLKDRVFILVKPHTEVLAVLALVDPDRRMSDHHLAALKQASNVLGLELSHRRNMAELELNIRRELIDDLVAGTDEEGAYARADALGHDLRRTHYVVVLGDLDGADSAIAAAAGRAAAALGFEYLLGRHARLVVMITAGRPKPHALYQEISHQLGKSDCVIGIGSACERPSDYPESFVRARRALNVRLHSATPAGASAYDELGFYHLVDAAGQGAQQFVRDWLGVLIDYDSNKRSDLVHTLSAYLESGGSYDETAATLGVHRSTLRYRLSRIRQLTGHDVRNVDARFNLHAATRTWGFLNSSG